MDAPKPSLTEYLLFDNNLFTSSFYYFKQFIETNLFLNELSALVHTC